MPEEFEEFEEDEFEEYDAEDDKDEGQYLTFSVENESYGLEIIYVTEIIGIQRITEVPELPEYVKGIINLRGKIIPVMDIRLRFEKPFREYDEKTCIVVVEIEDISVGIIVDAVSEVITVRDEDIVPPPDLDDGYSQKYMKGIGKVGDEVKLLLDCDRLVNEYAVQDLN